MSKITLDILIGMLKAASTDETRWTLTHVFLTKVNGKLSARATDGHCAVMREIADPDLLEAIHDGDKIFLSASDLKALKSLASKFYHIPVKRAVANDTVTQVLVFTSGSQSTTIPINPTEMKYPDISGFFKSQYKTPIRVCFSAEILLDLVLAMKGDTKAPNCILEFDAENITGNPMRVTRMGSDGVGVLMPVRSNDSYQTNNDNSLKAYAERLK